MDATRGPGSERAVELDKGRRAEVKKRERRSWDRWNTELVEGRLLGCCGMGGAKAGCSGVALKIIEPNGARSTRKDGHNGHKRNDVPGLVWNVEKRDNNEKRKDQVQRQMAATRSATRGDQRRETWDEVCLMEAWSRGASWEAWVCFSWWMEGINGRRGPPVAGKEKGRWCSSRSRQRRAEAYHVFAVQDGPPIAFDAAQGGDV